MRSRPCRIYRTIANILLVSIWFITCAYSDLFAQPDLQSKQGGEAKVENQFTAFKNELERLINERITTIITIIGWMPVEPGDRFTAVIASVREPMTERLKQIRNQFMDEINGKPLKIVVQEALINDPTISAQVDKYFHDVNARLMEHYYRSRAELASLLHSERSGLETQKTVGIISGIALLLFITGTTLLIYSSRQPKNEPAEPIRLVKGTVRSIIALASIYLIFVLAVLGYLVGQQSPSYLTAALVSVIVLYFFSRAIDAAYAPKPGFTFLKTFPDGTRERLQSHEQSESTLKATLMHLQITIEKLNQTVQEIQKHE
jgi:hypothetical protein